MMLLLMKMRALLCLRRGGDAEDDADDVAAT